MALEAWCVRVVLGFVFSAVLLCPAPLTMGHSGGALGAAEGLATPCQCNAVQPLGLVEGFTVTESCCFCFSCPLQFEK